MNRTTNIEECSLPDVTTFSQWSPQPTVRQVRTNRHSSKSCLRRTFTCVDVEQRGRRGILIPKEERWRIFDDLLSYCLKRVLPFCANGLLRLGAARTMTPIEETTTGGGYAIRRPGGDGTATASSGVASATTRQTGGRETGANGGELQKGATTT